MRASRATLLLIPLLLGVYGYRAVTGVVGGLALARGIPLAQARDYEGAVPLLEAGAVGVDRLDSLRYAADARLDVWEVDSKSGGPLGADEKLLQEAARDYLECLCLAPASRRPLEGLALVYHKLEWIGRERRSEETPFRSDSPTWNHVGSSGRIAIGMMRRAVQAAPNWFTLNDWLARALWDDGVEDGARQAVRDAARSLPLYSRHAFPDDEPMTTWVRDTFAETSREMLGRTPFVTRSQQLIDLGKLERERGDNERAVAAFTEALAGRVSELERAEAAFHMGHALLALGQDAEGRDRLAEAAQHPVFKTAALIGLARAAEQTKDDERALTHWRELRREEPGNLDFCLNFARVATGLGDWPAVLEALRWAKMIQPTDPRAYVALVESYVSMGDKAAARVALDELKDWFGGGTPDVERLSAMLASRS